MYPRRLIIPGRSVAHVFFRCHNKEFFLQPECVKIFLIRLWAKYKKRYGVRIFDFNIMDNHAHLLARAENAESMGNFMRTVNSQLSRIINKHFDRDSQALRERYKSPMVTNESYTLEVMKYIWLNRYKVDKRYRPDQDPFCSASWRLYSHYKNKFYTEDEENKELIDNLLDPYQACGLEVETGKDTVAFVRDLLNAALSKLADLCAKTLTHSTTIGDKESVNFRSQLLRAFRREKSLSFGV